MFSGYFPEYPGGGAVLFRLRRNKESIKKTRTGIQEALMNIIIAGDGKVGSMLTRQLSAEGHDITIIDSNARVL